MANYTGSIADAGRLIHIAKRRERHKEDIEKQRQKIQAQSTAVADIGEKFKVQYDAVESRLRMNTVGLVTLDEMRAKQEEAVLERNRLLALCEQEKRQSQEQAELDKKRARLELQNKSVLSFDVDEEDQAEDALEKDDAETVVVEKKKCLKDPTVDTSFLPDRNREEEENRLRQQLCEEWVKRQATIKNEEINIAFSYWDGSGHRRDLKMKKGCSIEQFLQRALDQLRPDFSELKTVTMDSLMFVKEDLIIPHFYTFYDFIVTKTMGKTGPLFEFDAAGELRIRQDAMVDTSESHPAKVVLRQWYERNKHIYPASRWEPFDPNKKYHRTTEDLREL